MNIGAVLAGIALLVLVVAYVARPLFEKQARGNNRLVAGTSSRAPLTDRRDAVYALIRELDADYQTGKVTDKDYQAQRERYVTEGVSLLKQLDALPSKDSSDKLKTSSRAARETEIEAAVLALRTTRAASSALPHEPATRFCTQCGHPAASEDSFCGQCGTQLTRMAMQ